VDTFISNSPHETFELGQRWATELQRGWVVGLIGDLGTGKTQPLAHIDLYRLESPSEIVGAGLEHYLTQSDGVAAVEWFERWLGGDWQLGQPLPESAQPSAGQVLRLVIFSDEGETKRKITYEDFGL